MGVTFDHKVCRHMYRRACMRIEMCAGGVSVCATVSLGQSGPGTRRGPPGPFMDACLDMHMGMCRSLNGSHRNRSNAYPDLSINKTTLPLDNHETLDRILKKRIAGGGLSRSFGHDEEGALGP